MQNLGPASHKWVKVTIQQYPENPSFIDERDDLTLLILQVTNIDIVCTKWTAGLWIFFCFLTSTLSWIFCD